MSSVLGIFCRYPAPGRVKTRLAATLGDELAAELYAAFLRDAARLTCTLNELVVWAYTPNDRATCTWFNQLTGHDAGVWPQPHGTLGDRLAAFFRSQFQARCERVVVIGSDSPTLPGEYLTAAFQQLTTADVVLGPAIDGGYYLIGLRKDEVVARQEAAWPAPLFDDIAWSGPDVLAQTITRIQAAGRSLALLPPWYDVDTTEDLRVLQRHLQSLEAAGIACPCPETHSVLSRMEC